MKTSAMVAASLLGVVVSSGVVAADPPVVGRWQTVDDKSGKPRSVVKTWLKDRKLFGLIEQLNEPGGDPDAKCTKCKGDKKDQRIAGMTILWDLTQDGDEWTGGKILDPDSGDIYKCKVKASGDKLEVRGFLGIALIGRTQTWRRAQ